MSYQKITLENLFSGDLEEKFQYELDKIKKNLKDMNTGWQKNREINIKIIFQCNEERTMLNCSASIAAKTVPVNDSIGFLKIDQKSTGDIEITQDDVMQQDLFKDIDIHKEEININQ